MNIILIGASGTIGQAVAQELGARHEIISVGRNHGDLQVDITDATAIIQMYKTIGSFDALIATTGNVVFAKLENLSEEKFKLSLQDKLMGQINLVLLGKDYISEHGSFTLTSGILNHDPIQTGCAAATVNAALEGFVKSAAIELPRGIRINVVSPTVILESMGTYAPYFRGYQPVPAAVAAPAYSKSVEGLQTGQVYKVGY